MCPFLTMFQDFINRISCMSCFWKAVWLFGALYAVRYATVTFLIPYVPSALGRMIQPGMVAGDLFTLYFAVMLVEGFAVTKV